MATDRPVRDALKYLGIALLVWAYASLSNGWVTPMIIIECALVLGFCSALGRAAYDRAHRA